MTRSSTPETPRAAVLTLRGDVDFFTEDAFRAEAEQLLAEQDVTSFVVDLEHVQMLDSSGISLLVDLLRLCREMGLPMALRRVPERVGQLLDLTGLDQVLPIEDAADRGAS
jgi:stage II sporulation protein AA (anti-sigma F factor antagonist)